MAREMVDLGLSGLNGLEVQGVARTLVAGQFEALLERRKEIVDLDADDLQKLVAVATATRANCGGFGCG